MELKEHTFIRRFPEPLATELVSASECTTHPDGFLIFPENAQADAVYLVLSGMVDLIKGAETQGSLVGNVTSGGYFGEVGILSRTNRMARAVCRGPATALAKIPRDVFLSVVHRAPVSSVLDLLGKLGNNLREMDERYVRDVLRKERQSVIGEMAHKVIHDFKGPFSAISLGVEMIERVHRDEATVKFCSVMRRNLDLMEKMMQEILDFTSGNTTLRRQPISLHEILRDMAEDNQYWLQSQGVSFEVSGEDIVLDADPGRVRRALQNLLLNSLEAIERGCGNVISIRSRYGFPMCEVLFEDNGPGIPQQLGATVFDPFVSEGKKGGTGLGLSITKGIIEAHGGSITLGIPTSGRGAMFCIRLPVHYDWPAARPTTTEGD